MAKEQVMQLFRTAQVDATLRETLNTASTIEAFVLMAYEYGYDFTVEEWQQTVGFEEEGELSGILGI
jgi:predicted ribosomally synthesized peptide with nif11-like leader